MAGPERIDNLSVDSDIDVEDPYRGPSRPVLLRWRFLGFVAVGGAIGTGIREAIAQAWPPSFGGFPLSTFVINIVGAFLLGALLELLTRRGADEGHRRTLRLLLGTGMLGGFTTYSSFATDTALLTGTALDLAFGYAAATVVAGFIASATGVAVGSLLHRRTAVGATE